MRTYVISLLLFWVISLVLLPVDEALSPPEPSYFRFLFNATDLPPDENYDYIIVGGGTAGCPLAATLSEQSRVLILERGGSSHWYPSLMSQEGFPTTLLQVDAYDSPAQAFLSEDGVPNARGRVLGGSSAINAGFYTRADPEFFYGGGISWDMALVNQSYEWVEGAVAFTPELKNWQSAFRDGLLEAKVIPYNGFNVEHMVGTKIGATTFDSSGRRHSAADLLNYAKQENIRVALLASVERILLGSGSSKQGAIGVVYRDILGRHHRARLRRNGEVILCAGALGSPQLLLLSGIGPRPYLSSLGIPVAHHLPWVGQYMYDNPRNGISIVPTVPLEHSLIQVVGITELGVFLEATSNVIPFTSPAGYYFLHRPSPFFLTVATLMEKISGPLSTGALRLASTDVRDNPLVRFNYFSHPLDLERCIAGLRIIGEVLRSRSMDEFKFRDLFDRRNFRYAGPALPVNQSDDRLMGEFCRRTVTTIWHYHGGCVLGKVVDDDYRVMGLSGVRVIDGSTFSNSPGTNPQATLMMLGRYMGRRIITQRPKGARILAQIRKASPRNRDRHH